MLRMQRNFWARRAILRTNDIQNLRTSEGGGLEGGGRLTDRLREGSKGRKGKRRAPEDKGTAPVSRDRGSRGGGGGGGGGGIGPSRQGKKKKTKAKVKERTRVPVTEPKTR